MKLTMKTKQYLRLTGLSKLKGVQSFKFDIDETKVLKAQLQGK